MVVNGFNSNPSTLIELIFHCAINLLGAMDYSHKLSAKVPLLHFQHHDKSHDAMNYSHKLFCQSLEPDSFIFNTMIRVIMIWITPTSFFAKVWSSTLSFSTPL
ncbi:hypothetical protein AMTR_s00024p00038510 [Amborella trichopoda]|uniref:Uncharacterized protein n=1 Tax=Amborella trichopoda TaxID=13333 RepID=W1PT27_AMBTC|nr:hypothetical protein AMTR_s00024p00038510 [Amborella trichopoda]